MAHTGRDAVRDCCLQNNISARLLAAKSGVDAQKVEWLLTSSQDEFDPYALNGKEWERLISSAGASPEEWLNNAAELTSAQYPIEKANTAIVLDPQYGAGALSEPSPEADHRIRAFLKATNTFYLAASNEWLKRQADDS